MKSSIARVNLDWDSFACFSTWCPHQRLWWE